MAVNVAIDPALKERYPQIRLGCLAYEAKVEKENPALWAEMESRVVPETLQLLEEKGLTGLEGIRSSREAYKAFGRNPTRYRVSSESLIRRIRQGHPLYRVNTVVDANNLISVETAMSAGSYDLDRLQGRGMKGSARTISTWRRCSCCPTARGRSAAPPATPTGR